MPVSWRPRARGFSMANTHFGNVQYTTGHINNTLVSLYEAIYGNGGTYDQSHSFRCARSRSRSCLTRSNGSTVMGLPTPGATAGVSCHTPSAGRQFARVPSARGAACSATRRRSDRHIVPRCRVMHTYEIRVFHDNGSLARLRAEVQVTDSAAIRSGAAIAQGRQYEVWRRLECMARRDQPALDETA